MADRPKLLWHSNAPWVPTGYGNQTGIFTPLLSDRYDIAISSFYGLEGARLKWEGIPVFPGNPGTFGNEYILGHARSHFDGELRGGMVLTLLDVWVLDPNVFGRLDVACWVPVDHEPVPPKVARFLAQSNALPIAMSQFGQEQLKNAGIDALYVPHGIDVDVYRPRPQEEAKQMAGIPEDAFLIGMVAANKGRAPSRKGFQQALHAFKIFREKHDDALLYLHTVMDPTFVGGEDIMAIMQSLGIDERTVRIADQYDINYDPYSSKVMSRIYSAFDVLLHPAMAEGFGIPLVEAAACGVPAVATNFSAIPEVSGASEFGWPVRCTPFWTYQESWQTLPDVEEIVAGLEQAYGQSKAEASKRRHMARQHSLNYAAPKVLTDHMLPALEEAQRRFDERAPGEVVEAVAA